MSKRTKAELEKIRRQREAEQEAQRLLEEELDGDEKLSAEVIAKRTAEIRAKWTKTEERSRRGVIVEPFVEVLEFRDNRRNQR